jgi:crotonobetainyl-CoA:carnitine CoA-transferase CaiB-like acyl-CoA transferase
MAERFLDAYGLGDLLRDPRFATNETRVQHAAELDEHIAAAIEARTLDENLAIIDEHDLTAVAVQTVADIERDQHWRSRHLLVDVPNGNGAVRMHTVVPRLSDTPGEIREPGGCLGQDNDAVYSGELGLTSDEIAHLRVAGII